jgi:hypothetical protein
VAASAVAASFLVTAPAHAAGCGTVMTFQFNPASGGVELSPSKVTVAARACVTLHNNTITTATFTIGSRYKATAPAFSDATPAYSAAPAGSTQPVTATGAAGTAKGSIVVKSAPTKPSPSPTHASPRPTRSPSPAQSRQPSPTPTAPRPTAPARTPTAAPPPVNPLTPPPPGSSPFLAGTPTPTPSPTHSGATILTGPLQPPTDRGIGLPAALAALAVVGTAGALLRVLLAEPIGPVDDRRTVRAAT